MTDCGCLCLCHRYAEDGVNYPGPCAGCCEPGDDCECGYVLARLLKLDRGEDDCNA